MTRLGCIGLFNLGVCVSGFGHVNYHTSINSFIFTPSHVFIYLPNCHP